jgi:hypothetical protein
MIDLKGILQISQEDTGGGAECPELAMAQLVLGGVRILKLLDSTKRPPARRLAIEIALAKEVSEEGNYTDVSCSINSTTHCNNLFCSEKCLRILGRRESTIRERPNSDNGDRVRFVFPQNS